MQFSQEITKQFIYNSIIDGNPQYDIKPKNIYDFLSTGSKFKRIPDYQRPYSWEKKHLLDFLNDALNVFTNDNQRNNWFLGSIYVTKQSSSDDVSYVLDGQQRLTTLQIILVEVILSRFYDNSLVFKDDFEHTIHQIRDCLLVNEGAGNYVPRFSSDKITNDFLQNYIQESIKVKSFDDYSTFYEDFQSKIGGGISKSNSVNTLYNNIKYTTTFIKEQLFENKSKNQFIESIDLIPDRISFFIKTILYSFWLIEIPLIQESISVEIFEGLNNRGKPLSLLDKLQFRSLSKKFGKQSEIKSNWGGLYELSDKLKRNSNLFKNEEDFIQSFFLSLLGKEISSEAEYIEIFENRYLTDFEKLTSFFVEVKRIMTFFISLNSLDDSAFVESFKDNNQKNKVKATLILLRKFLKTYKNTSYPIINLLHHYDDNDESNKYIIIQSLWSILKLSYYKNIFEGQSPNDIRKDFNHLIYKYTNKNPEIYPKLLTELLSKKEEEEEEQDEIHSLLKLNNIKIVGNNPTYNYNKQLESNSSLLNTSDNGKSQLVLYLFSVLTNYKSVISYTSAQHEKADLEHIFPRAWKKHWMDKKYSKNEVVAYLESISKNKLKDFVDQSQEFELKDYTSSPFIQDETLIEWIGNKLALSDWKNRKISNREFNHKKDQYLEGGNMLIPTSKGKTDLDVKFDFKTIIDRSLHIVDSISESYLKSTWDSIN